jgi:hypothetical protein
MLFRLLVLLSTAADSLACQRELSCWVLSSVCLLHTIHSLMVKVRA